MAKRKQVTQAQIAAEAAEVMAEMAVTHPIVAPVAEVVAPAPAPAVAVALRGGGAVTALKLGGKPYRVTAPHNRAWWDAIVSELVARGGVANVADLQEVVGCPLTHFGYLLRRGHLAAHVD
jgi:hypothetical protein